MSKELRVIDLMPEELQALIRLEVLQEMEDEKTKKEKGEKALQKDKPTKEEIDEIFKDWYYKKNI